MNPNTPSSPEVVRKRVVLRHATGRLAGLLQILGVLEGTPETLAEIATPSILHGDMTAPQTAHHEKTSPRYIQYREWAQAPTGQLNDFNPAQV